MNTRGYDKWLRLKAQSRQIVFVASLNVSHFNFNFRKLSSLIQSIKTQIKFRQFFKIAVGCSRIKKLCEDEKLLFPSSFHSNSDVSGVNGTSGIFTCANFSTAEVESVATILPHRLSCASRQTLFSMACRVWVFADVMCDDDDVNSSSSRLLCKIDYLFFPLSWISTVFLLVERLTLHICN